MCLWLNSIYPNPHLRVPPMASTLVWCPCFVPGEAVFSRCLSSLKDDRVEASKHLQGPPSSAFSGDKKQFIEDVSIQHTLVLFLKQSWNKTWFAKKKKKKTFCRIHSVYRGEGTHATHHLWCLCSMWGGWLCGQDFSGLNAGCRCTFREMRPHLLHISFRYERLFTPPRSYPTLRASCWWEKPPNSSAGNSTTEALRSCGEVAASSEGEPFNRSVPRPFRTCSWRRSGPRITLPSLSLLSSLSSCCRQDPLHPRLDQRTADLPIKCYASHDAAPERRQTFLFYFVCGW